MNFHEPSRWSRDAVGIDARREPGDDRHVGRGLPAGEARELRLRSPRRRPRAVRDRRWRGWRTRPGRPRGTVGSPPGPARGPCRRRRPDRVERRGPEDDLAGPAGYVARDDRRVDRALDRLQPPHGDAGGRPPRALQADGLDRPEAAVARSLGSMSPHTAGVSAGGAWRTCEHGVPRRAVQGRGRHEVVEAPAEDEDGDDAEGAERGAEERRADRHGGPARGRARAPSAARSSAVGLGARTFGDAGRGRRMARCSQRPVVTPATGATCHAVAAAATRTQHDDGEEAEPEHEHVDVDAGSTSAFRAIPNGNSGESSRAVVDRERRATERGGHREQSDRGRALARSLKPSAASVSWSRRSLRAGGVVTIPIAVMPGDGAATPRRSTARS